MTILVREWKGPNPSLGGTREGLAGYKLKGWGSGHGVHGVRAKADDSCLGNRLLGAGNRDRAPKKETGSDTKENTCDRQAPKGYSRELSLMTWNRVRGEMKISFIHSFIHVESHSANPALTAALSTGVRTEQRQSRCPWRACHLEGKDNCERWRHHGISPALRRGRAESGELG